MIIFKTNEKPELNKGVYIYACDEGLRQALQNSMEME